MEREGMEIRRIKVEHLSAEEERDAIVQLALTYLDIDTCRKCGHPRVSGYVCVNCDDSNADQSYRQEECDERKYFIGGKLKTKPKALEVGADCDFCEYKFKCLTLK